MSGEDDQMKRTAPAAGGRRAPLTMTATAVVLLQLVAACAAGPSPSATAATSPTATAGAASQAPQAAAPAPPAAPSGSPVAGAPANPAASPAAAASSPVAQAGPLVVNPALQQAEGGLELVVAAYNVLQDRFFRPLDSRQLLGAAWEGARRELTQQRKLPNNVDPAQLSGDREADLASFADRYRALMAAAGDGVDRTRVAMVATSAMAESVGEQHTAFLTPDQFTRFKARITSEPGSVGLGILIDGQRAPFTIANVIPGGPSEQAGVQEGDQIERVNGRDVGRLELRELSELLRGEAGQPATLTLRRGGDTLDLTVTRARFTVPPLQSRILPEGVCYLRLQTFPAAFVVGPSGRTLPQELDTQLERCEQAGARGWIMDLRGNGGGSGLSQVLGRFLDQGPILVERDKIGGRYEQATDGHPFRVQRPLVVLIDGGSASASEAFASAVQEYGRGVVMGQRSAGALNTANIVPLPLDAGMSVARSSSTRSALRQTSSWRPSATVRPCPAGRSRRRSSRRPVWARCLPPHRPRRGRCSPRPSCAA
jgi:C-terminal peptidase prc